MNITKVWIEAGCTACDLCVDSCPEVFKAGDAATVIEGAIFLGNEEKIREASENCPVEVIKYREE